MHGVLWMTIEQQKKLVARLRRLAGQVRALEGTLRSSESEVVVNQFLAVNAASKAALRLYLEWEVLAGEGVSSEQRRLLVKLLGRVD